MLKRYLVTMPAIGLLIAVSHGVALAADVDAGGKIAAEACVACHGADGNSIAPTFPNLAGQAAGYTAQQLQAIKSGERAVPEMAGLLTEMSTEDMQNLAAFYAAQTPKKAAISEAEREAAERGERLYRGGDAKMGIAACTSCHSPDGHGVPELFPSVANQHTDYLKKQLLAYKSGERQSREQIMNNIAFLLSVQQIEDVATYMHALQ